MSMFPKEYEYYVNEILKDLRVPLIRSIHEWSNEMNISEIGEKIERYTNKREKYSKPKKDLFALDLGELVDQITRNWNEGIGKKFDYDRFTYGLFQELRIIRNHDAHYHGWDDSIIIRYLDTFRRIIEILHGDNFIKNKVQNNCDKILKIYYYNKFPGEIKMEDAKNIENQVEMPSEKNRDNQVIEHSTNELNSDSLKKATEKESNHIESNPINDDLDNPDPSEIKIPSLLELVKQLKIFCYENSNNKALKIYANILLSLTDKFDKVLSSPKLEYFHNDNLKFEYYHNDTVINFLNNYQEIKNDFYLREGICDNQLFLDIDNHINNLNPDLVVLNEEAKNYFYYCYLNHEESFVEFIDDETFTSAFSEIINNSIKIINEVMKDELVDYGYSTQVLYNVFEKLEKLESLVYQNERGDVAVFLVRKPCIFFKEIMLQKAKVLISDPNTVKYFNKTKSERNK